MLDILSKVVTAYTYGCLVLIYAKYKLEILRQCTDADCKDQFTSFSLYRQYIGIIDRHAKLATRFAMNQQSFTSIRQFLSSHELYACLNGARSPLIYLRIFIIGFPYPVSQTPLDCLYPTLRSYSQRIFRTMKRRDDVP